MPTLGAMKEKRVVSLLMASWAGLYRLAAACSDEATPAPPMANPRASNGVNGAARLSVGASKAPIAMQMFERDTMRMFPCVEKFCKLIFQYRWRLPRQASARSTQ